MRFEGQYQAHDSCSDGGGWGQFLDGPRPHRQIGLYGTSAGLLVLSLADRDETPCTVGATNLLSAWWQERDTGYGKSKFCQNSRLAFFALCLRNTPNEVAKRMSQEVEKELINRISSRGKWGDYWVKKNVQDISPRYFATALSTLSLSILLLATEQVQPHLEQACAFLRQTLSTNPHLTTTERGLLAAAILAGSGSAQNRKVFKIFNDLARQPEDTLSQHHTYPFEYIYMEPDSSSFVWNRDSVYLYSELMTGIAGFLPKAPTALRLRAESILKQVLNNISSEGGSFRPLQGGRISSVEQAWCSVFLALAKLQAEHRTHGWRKIHYALVRQRQSSTFNDKILPLSAIMVTALISALPLSSISFTIAKVLGSLAIFGLYGETIIKRIFPGR
jgi:hypothetical protein